MRMWLKRGFIFVLLVFCNGLRAMELLRERSASAGKLLKGAVVAAQSVFGKSDFDVWYKTVAAAPENPGKAVAPLMSAQELEALLRDFMFGMQGQQALWYAGTSIDDLNAGGLDGNTKFGNLYNNAHQAFDGNKRLSDSYSHIRRLTLLPGTRVVFAGDLHGSLHSLMRKLAWMRKENLLRGDFLLADGVYFICLGDIVDRGWYGAECWYTLLRLKQRNPERVMLVRGNHEDDAICKGDSSFLDGIERTSFWNELEKKFGQDAVQLQRCFTQAYRLMPLAVYVGNGTDWVQCCHGGIDPSLDFSSFLELSQDTIKIIAYMKFDGAVCNGLLWGDYMQMPVKDKLGQERHIVYQMGRSWCCSVQAAQDYFGKNPAAAFAAFRNVDPHGEVYPDILSRDHVEQKPFLMPIITIRGHQDTGASPIKLFFGSAFNNGKFGDFVQLDTYDGPKSWHLVHGSVFDSSVPAYVLPFDVLKPEGIAPIITITDATDTQGVMLASCPLLTIGKAFGDWVLRVKFLPLDAL